MLMMLSCRESQDTDLVYRVTADGLAGVVFNGVCDWLYRGQCNVITGSINSSPLTATICYYELLLLTQQLRVFKRKLFA